MFEEDVNNALAMIKDAHHGTPNQEWDGEIVEGEIPCRIGGALWYKRIEDILYNQFQGAYQLLDFMEEINNERAE